MNGLSVFVSDEVIGIKVGRKVRWLNRAIRDAGELFEIGRARVGKGRL